MMANNVWRRRQWFTENTSAGQVANLLLAGAQFALKNETMRAWPVLVKVDISPLCNLKCTYCVHASPSGQGDDPLQAQSFKGRHKMGLEHYERLIDEIAGKSMAVSLYYLGDPLVHPDLNEMCRIARAARLNSHISSHFSFNLSDSRIYDLVTSGLTHLTVCVDGMRQESYERTRVGGRLDVVLSNLDRVLRIRRELRQRYPRVEVQFIKFQHNLDELDEAARWCGEHGADQFTDYWGHLHNYADVAPGAYNVIGPKADKRLPQCMWPHFSLQIKYNGDVIPCCYYRHTDQYRGDGQGDSRIVGNVFQTSVWEVWNSPAYQQLRRLVSNPTRAASEPSLTTTFCGGCPSVFETDADARARTADTHRWEDLYARDERNRVVRK
jgi:MoaA/NifB/PqqE/SkfB family radical SAM enzyme